MQVSYIVEIGQLQASILVVAILATGILSVLNAAQSALAVGHVMVLVMVIITVGPAAVVEELTLVKVSYKAAVANS